MCDVEPFTLDIMQVCVTFMRPAGMRVCEVGAAVHWLLGTALCVLALVVRARSRLVVGMAQKAGPTSEAKRRTPSSDSPDA